MSYAGNPNGQNQLWSRWTFTVHEIGPRHVPRKDVEYNAARWCRKMFGSAGSVRVRSDRLDRWTIDLIIEGVPAHDPTLVDRVRSQFQRNFAERGWGPLCASTVSARVLAGSLQNGRPAEQMVSMPFIELLKCS